MNARFRLLRTRISILIIAFAMRPEFIIGCFLLAAMVYKIKLMRPSAVGSIVLAVIQHDAFVLGLVLLLYTVGLISFHLSERPQSGRHIIRAFSNLITAIALLIVGLYVSDVFCLYFFGTRLYASDLVTFSSQLDAGTSLAGVGVRILFGYSFWKLAAIGITIALLFHACYRLFARRHRGAHSVRYAASFSLSLGVFYSIPFPAYLYSYPDKQLYENFIQRNANFFNNNSFSDEYRTKVLSDANETSCKPGRAQPINVILLIVESLSAYQSKLFSGIEDWTPQLDEIARHETAVTNFYANGWTTIGGLLSLVGGTFPLVPEKAKFNLYGSPRFADYLDLPYALPRYLVKDGYTTAFVAAGDLSFLGMNQWLQSIGFEHLVGGDDPRFAGQKLRGPFNSVPDQLLFKVAVDEVELMPRDKPFFMTVETYWSHRPFMDPNGKHLDGEEPVVRETDRQIRSFYDRLMQSGFFENGLLLITGDHRAAEPLRKSEFDRFGASAIARIPAVIVTRAISLPSEINQDFQQRDLGASIKNLVSKKVCFRSYEGSFLGEELQPPNCVIHAQGIDRDLVLVKCGTMEATVHVSGDKTRVVSGKIEDSARVVETINFTRARPPGK